MKRTREFCIAALAAVLVGIVTLLGVGATAQTVGPSAQELLGAQRDVEDWLLPAHGYEGNRYVESTITKANVAKLGKAWTTQLADDGEQEAAPIVWHGTMYLSTPHEHVIALDAKTGKLKWHFPYTPAYVLDFAVNRGVGLGDGKVFIATQDCHLIALDAQTGKKLWDKMNCYDTTNSWYSMAVYVFKDKILLGSAGGDFGSIGHMSAFSMQDGSRLWDWQTIPGPGQPGHDTWPGDSWKHGGGALWGGISLDPAADMLYIAPGNPGPDFVRDYRLGKNLYTNSIVALDISGPKPRMKWYYQLIAGDTHDADPAMHPIVFDGKVNGAVRKLVAIGDKAGNFVILDRMTGKVVHRMSVSNQTGLQTTVPTIKGTTACPNHGGGIEWLGGAFDPATNLFVIPSTQECGFWKRLPGPPKYIPGQHYSGGVSPKRQGGTGVVSAIDVSTGKFKWRKPLPYPAQGGALITNTGLTFTSDLAGNVYAFDTANGAVLWKSSTGSSTVAPFSTYRVGGDEYLAILSGQAGNQQTPNLPVPHGSVVTAFKLGATSTIANSSAGQGGGVVVTGANSSAQKGTAPYTLGQVHTGKALYGQQCAVCHGAQLQGISAPALAGSAFGRSHLTISQLRNVVTVDMPLTAPGTLAPQQYSAIMAYLLAANCVKTSGSGTTRFPNADQPAFKTVTLVGASCPVK